MAAKMDRQGFLRKLKSWRHTKRDPSISAERRPQGAARWGTFRPSPVSPRPITAGHGSRVRVQPMMLDACLEIKELSWWLGMNTRYFPSTREPTR